MNRKAFVFLIAGLACLALLVGGSPARAADPIVIPPGGPEAPYQPAGGEPVVVPGRLPVGADTYTGTLNIISGDPQDFAGEPVEHYFLARPGGAFIELRLTDAVARADLYALNGKPVIVTGRPPVSEPSTSALGEPAVLTVTAIQAAEPRAAEAAAITGNTKWVTIACKFADIADEPKPISYFQNMYANTYPGLDHYWREASYDAINLSGSQAVGWYTLPKTRDQYLLPDGSADLVALQQDCWSVADPSVYFPDYFGIMIALNDGLGRSACGSATLAKDGVTKAYASCILYSTNGYDQLGIVQHEMGHGYGLRHSYALDNAYGNRWDVMSRSAFNCESATNPTYGCVGQHTIADNRYRLGWIPASRTYIASAGTDGRSASHSVVIGWATQPPPEGYLLAIVPINGSAQHYYTVEARRPIGYDSKLPGSGVIIHEIGGMQHSPRLMGDASDDMSYTGDIWTPGEKFVGPEGGITIEIKAATVSGYSIGISNGLPVGSITLSPIGDTYVRRDAPNSTYGNSTELAVRGVYADDPLLSMAALRFDTSRIPPTACRYRLRVRIVSDGGGTWPGTAKLLSPYYRNQNTSWTESGLTWNNIGDNLSRDRWPLRDGFWLEWDLTQDINAIGIQTFKISDTNSPMRYSSREGANPPQLIVDYLVPPSNTPPNTPANPTPADGATGVATNAALSWTGGDPDAGDTVTYDVYFGTSNPPPLVVSQSATTYSPGLVNMTTYYWKVVARDSQGATTAGPLWSFTTVTAGVTTLPLYLSPTGTGTIDGKGFTGADILIYNKTTNSWSFFYDGSAAGTPKNVSAFAYNGADIILGFSAAQTISGVGTFNPQDLARFTPTRTGYNNTAGRFYWFFDGSDVGLTTSAEAIDASWIDAQGRLYISTAGSGSVPVDSANPSGAKITFQDEDILRFTNSQLGATTAGRWELYWNPTAMPGMSAEDINGYWEDPASGFRYVTILGAFSIGDPAYGKQTGNGKTIVRFTPNAAAPGGWAPVSTVTWLATGATFPSQLDAIAFGRW